MWLREVGLTKASCSARRQSDGVIARRRYAAVAQRRETIDTDSVANQENT